MKTILIVDDSVTMRRALRNLLEQQPEWRVCGEATNGREGVAKAQELRPDLILLDLAMPIMNGLDAAAELSRIMPGVAMLMFTNFDHPQLQTLATTAGIRAVASKSEPPMLIHCIEELFRLSNSIGSERRRSADEGEPRPH